MSAQQISTSTLPSTNLDKPQDTSVPSSTLEHDANQQEGSLEAIGNDDFEQTSSGFEMSDQ